MTGDKIEKKKQWYALRDLKRSNALLPAFLQLRQAGVEVFTPTKWRLVVKGGRKVRREIAVVHDLLFAYESRETLDPVIAKIPTLQYRYKRGGSYCEPIVVPEDEMQRFIDAVNATENPKYYSVEEIPALKCGQRIRIVGGPMSGHEGKLLSVRGSKVKRLLVELPNLMAISIEIQDEYIQIV